MKPLLIAICRAHEGWRYFPQESVVVHIVPRNEFPQEARLSMGTYEHRKVSVEWVNGFCETMAQWFFCNWKARDNVTAKTMINSLDKEGIPIEFWSQDEWTLIFTIFYSDVFWCLLPFVFRRLTKDRFLLGDSLRFLNELRVLWLRSKKWQRNDVCTNTNCRDISMFKYLGLRIMFAAQFYRVNWSTMELESRVRLREMVKKQWQFLAMVITKQHRAHNWEI